MTEPTCYELSSAGRHGLRFPDLDVPESAPEKDFVRKSLELPELSELDVVRHFTHLSKLNYSVDQGLYPLGSCTMKYNPRVNEVAARLNGFSNTHPLQPNETIQGNLSLMYFLQEWLKQITGFDAFSLQPSAGAQGEFVGGLIIRAYHRFRKEEERNKILVPDSAHGTNPATTNMAGFKVINIPSDQHGNLDIGLLKESCDQQLAGLMLTNPNTLGLFEEHLLEVVEIVHKNGGLVYGDGANLNALLGILRPADTGIDIMHLNLHKTFATPHGGGGPGSGPVGVVEKLKDFLPEPIVGIIQAGDEGVPPIYELIRPEHSIGRVKSFHGHFGVLVRAYMYISMLGAEGLRRVAEHAVLNANYLMTVLKTKYHLPFDRKCMHEFVLEGCWHNLPDIHALDISKRLMDYGFHPPTNYFPLIVKEALMIEPTETESLDTLKQFADAMLKIADEAHSNPEILKMAPHNTPVGRLDEVKAARELVLCCHPSKQD